MGWVQTRTKVPRGSCLPWFLYWRNSWIAWMTGFLNTKNKMPNLLSWLTHAVLFSCLPLGEALIRMGYMIRLASCILEAPKIFCNKERKKKRFILVLLLLFFETISLAAFCSGSNFFLSAAFRLAFLSFPSIVLLSVSLLSFQFLFFRPPGHAS